MVFTHEIDPSFPGNQQEKLNENHSQNNTKLQGIDGAFDHLNTGFDINDPSTFNKPKMRC